MNLLEITIFLVNVLLVVVIVAAFVHLRQRIDDQGLKIQLLLTHEKEGFSPAQRIGMAAKYNDQPNALMPSFNQSIAENTEWKPTMTNERGDRKISHLLPSTAETSTKTISETVTETISATAEELAKAGSSAAADVTFNDTSLPDTSDEPVTVQQGVIEEGFAGSNTRAAPPFLSSGAFNGNIIKRSEGFSAK